MNTRAIAAKILAGVIRDKQSLTELFHQKLPTALSDRDRGLTKEYCYGVLRRYDRLKIIADALVYRPIKSKEQEIISLILMGLYQLIYLNTPPHAAVSETVAAARTLKKSWATGLINQALHQFLKRSDFFLEKADASETGKFSHPQWMIDTLKIAWPAQWELILQANNQQAPMFLRVNAQKNSRDAYRERLQKQSITAFPIDALPQALCLQQPQSVENLPGFKQGCCSIQDLASQYIIPLLDLQPGQRILDACAAPGGKTGHILEASPNLSTLVAVEKDSARLQLVKENIERLNLGTPTQLLLADAAHPATWWDGQQFDRILLDAPCSGTGVIRRHPDIKILRKAEDIAAYARQQSVLLTALWPLLKPSGRLLYTTCSIFPEENVQVMNRFCQSHADANALPVSIPAGIPQKIGLQLLPEPKAHDGFYFALLEKTAL